MEMSNPSGFIAQGHQLVERGVALIRAASAVTTPDVGFDAPAVTDALASLSETSRSLGDRLTDTGDDLAFVARWFATTDEHVGDFYTQLLLTGRFS